LFDGQDCNISIWYFTFLILSFLFKFSLYYRDVETDGIIKDWALMSGTTDAFSDICDIDITLQLE